MTNRSQETISEIRRKQKRLKTTQKTIDQIDAVLAKSTKILVDGPSYQRSAVPSQDIVEGIKARQALKKARKELRQTDMVLNKYAQLLRQRGVRPYRKRQKVVAIH